MASEQCVLDYVCRALWDAQPTRTDKRAQQLAFALGYPLSWRVVRTLEDAPVQITTSSTTLSSGEETKKEKDAEGVGGGGEPAPQELSASTTTDVVAGDEGPKEEVTEDKELVLAEQEGEVPAKKDDATHKASSPPDTAAATTEEVTSSPEAALSDSAPTAAASAPSATTVTTTTAIVTRKCIVDRIYAGKPGSGCDMWFHHQEAMKAAETWDPESSTAPFEAGGGHLLPRQPLFTKGDKVQVLYDGQWWDATILRRKGDKTGFKYGVHYASDGTKQSGVDESAIQFRPQLDDPKLVAKKLGLDGWEAYASAHSRYKIVAPNGEVYHGKKQAMEAYARYHGGVGGGKDASGKDVVGDPPWRRDGNEYVGRRVVHTVEHKASARRTVKIDQVGTVTGWISDTDVDRAGQPGFVSERTGKPANLYHVQFDEVPHHTYASLLLDAIDMEEYELEQCLVEVEDPALQEPPKKKAKTSSA